MKNFTEKCYEIVRTIPKGKVTTYKEIAQALHSKGYRAVGHAMSTNKDVPHTPCHRVVGSQGDITGYIHGTHKKRTMLKKEGVTFNGKKVDLKKHFYAIKKK